MFACERQPQTKRTATLVSKSGAGAYLEAKFRVVAATRDNREDEPSHKCRADWTLHVAAPGARDFAAVPVYGHTEKETDLSGRELGRSPLDSDASPVLLSADGMATRNSAERFYASTALWAALCVTAGGRRDGSGVRSERRGEEAVLGGGAESLTRVLCGMKSANACTIQTATK